MFFCEICEIFKSTYFEENLRKTALFVSPQNTIANSIDEFGLDETSHSAKQVFFFKRNNFICSNTAISFIYKFKNVSLTFQLIFFLNFLLCALFKFYLTAGKLGLYDVS